MWISAKQQFRHFLVLARLINFTRLWNLLQLGFSFFWSRIVKKPGLYGMPWAISVEPAGMCNLQCPECPVGAGVLTRKGDLMPLSLFKQILEQSGPRLMWVNLFFQGEPFINPHLTEMVSAASKQNIYTNISTNGHYLSEKKCLQLIEAGLSNLIISLDGITTETYSRYRKGGDLTKVQKGIERILKLRKDLKKSFPIITVQFVVFSHNQHEIKPLIKWCKQVGVDKLDLKSAQINDFGNGTVQPSTISRFSRYKTLPDGSLEMKNKSYNHCFRQWGSLVVSWDGQIAPCCYDKNLDLSPGNMMLKPLKNIWQSKSLGHLRQTILKEKNRIEMCRNCPEGRRFLI